MLQFTGALQIKLSRIAYNIFINALKFAKLFSMLTSQLIATRLECKLTSSIFQVKSWHFVIIALRLGV